MTKPQYELGPLRVGVAQCKNNIDAFRGAIANEERKILELQGHIEEWEEYNRSQGEGNGGAQ